MSVSYAARPGSVRIGPDQVQSLSPAQKGRIQRAIELHPDLDAYCAKISAWCLFHWVSSGGVCDPAYSSIAAGTRISVTTVKDRIKRMARAGVCSIVNRGVGLFRRFVQWTNAYLWTLPPEPETATPKEPVRSEGVRPPPNTNPVFIKRLPLKQVPKRDFWAPTHRSSDRPGALLERALAEIEAGNAARKAAALKKGPGSDA